jgi:hypothetical protein
MRALEKMSAQGLAIQVVQKLPGDVQPGDDLRRLGVFNMRGTIYVLEDTFRSLSEDQELAAVLFHEALEVHGVVHDDTVEIVRQLTGFENDYLIEQAGLSEKTRSGAVVEEITEKQALEMQRQGVATLRASRVEEPQAEAQDQETALETANPAAAKQLQVQMAAYLTAAREKFKDQPQVQAAVRAIAAGGPVVVRIIQKPVAIVQSVAGYLFMPRGNNVVGAPGKPFERMMNGPGAGPGLFLALLRHQGVSSAKAAELVQTLTGVTVGALASQVGMTSRQFEQVAIAPVEEHETTVGDTGATQARIPFSAVRPWIMTGGRATRIQENETVRRILPRDAQMVLYVLQTILFAGDSGYAGTLALGLPWEVSGPVMVTGNRLIQAAAFFYALHGPQLEIPDDLTPRFESLKREMTLPDAVAATRFDIKQIRLQPLSQLGKGWLRWLQGEGFGAYRENGHPENHEAYAIVYAPDALLQTFDQGVPQHDGSLALMASRYDYQVRAYLLGAILMHQTDKYYAGQRWNPLAEWLKSENPFRSEETLEQDFDLRSIQEGQLARDWYRGGHESVALNPAEISGLAMVYLREAAAVLHESPALGRTVIATQVQEQLRAGGQPTLTTVVDAMTVAKPGFVDYEAGWFKALARECQRLDPAKRKLVANSLMSLFVRQNLALSTAQRDAEPAVKGIREVRLMAMPRVNRKLAGAIDTTLEKLAGKSGAQGLVDRLKKIKQALQAVQGLGTGTLGRIDPAGGAVLLAELARFHEQNAADLLPLGEDVDRDIHAACTGHVQTMEVDGFAMANPMIFEISVPTRQVLKMEDVTAPRLPGGMLARRYNGEVQPRINAPFGLGMIGQAALFTLIRIWPLRRSHAVVEQQDPEAYLHWALSGLRTNRFTQVLLDPESPLGQAYLRFAANPENQKDEREFVKAMLRMLKAEGRDVLLAGDQQHKKQLAAEHQVSMAAFSEVSHRLRCLDSVVLGDWQKPPMGMKIKRVYAPRILMIQNSRGAMGLYYDLLADMPVKVDTEALEKRRRQHFQDTEAAA